MFFINFTITTITLGVKYLILIELMSDRRSDRRVIEVIEEGKRLHADVLHISKKPLRGELSGFLSIYQAEASCISPKVY